MPQPQTFTCWTINCQSPEDAQTLQQWLSSRINLDRVFTDAVRVVPNGVEQVRSEQHRLGDYFTAIRVIPLEQKKTESFRLLFQRRPDAKRYWKDLMVNILQEIESATQNASIALDSKGCTEPR